MSKVLTPFNHRHQTALTLHDILLNQFQSMQLFLNGSRHLLFVLRVVEVQYQLRLNHPSLLQTESQTLQHVLLIIQDLPRIDDVPFLPFEA
jgi:hypothetical protein